MINSALHHEITLNSSSIQNDKTYVYSPLHGTFYTSVYVPDNSVDLPTSYTGSVLFEISRYRFADVFAVDEFEAFGDPDRIGANVLEMFVSVEPIGVNFSTGPYVYQMIAGAVTHANNGDEYTEGIESGGNYYPFASKFSLFQGGDWDLTGITGDLDSAGNPTETFNLVYNNLTQTFQLKWWKSKNIDPFIVRGNYKMY